MTDTERTEVIKRIGALVERMVGFLEDWADKCDKKKKGNEDAVAVQRTIICLNALKRCAETLRMLDLMENGDEEPRAPTLLTEDEIRILLDGEP